MSDRFDNYNINRKVEEESFQLVINELPVNLLDFALISNLRHRVYGFRLFGTNECLDGCCLNDLARESVWRHLFGVQQYLISNKRIAIAPMYIEETAHFDRDATTFFTKFAALSATNIIETFEFITNLTINPFVQEDVALSINGSYIEARFDRSKAPNPEKVILRDHTDYTQFEFQAVAGYPKKEGSNWVMVVGNSMEQSYATDPTTQVDLQDYEYVVVDIVNDATLDLTKLVAFHPNSDQVLDFAKPPERVVVGDTTYIRFWFYVWTLGRPEFKDKYIDMVEAEFFKIYDSIPLYKRVEEEQIATLYVDQSTELDYACDVTTSDLDLETTSSAWIKIVNKEEGIVRYTEIYNTTEPPADPVYKVKTNGQPYGRRYKIKHYYKVDPFAEEGLILYSLEELRRAIVAKVAATIELEACNCVCASNDYIKAMQAEYTTEYISSVSGSLAVNYYYGRRRGDLIFAEVLKNLAFRPKVLVL